MDGIGDEFRDKDVVIGCIADGAAYDTYGEGEGGDGGNEVVGADYGCYDGGGDNYAADTEAGEDEEAPGAVESICFERGECADACCMDVSLRIFDGLKRMEGVRRTSCHNDGARNHQLSIVPPEHA